MSKLSLRRHNELFSDPDLKKAGEEYSGVRMEDGSLCVSEDLFNAFIQGALYFAAKTEHLEAEYELMSDAFNECLGFMTEIKFYPQPHHTREQLIENQEYLNNKRDEWFKANPRWRWAEEAIPTLRNRLISYRQQVKDLTAERDNFKKLFETSAPSLTEEIGKLRSKLRESEEREIALRKALKFYFDGSHWTTNDDELHFIKVTDQDWRKPNGNFCGGRIAEKALKETPEPALAGIVRRLVGALEAYTTDRFRGEAVAIKALAETEQARKELDL